MKSTNKKLSATRRLFSDPLLHFLALGVVIFSVYSWMPDNTSNVIVLPENEVREFVEDYRARFGDEPDETQIEEFRQNWLSEEVLFQEGLRLGLIQQDPVVRQRIVNKMQVVLAEKTSEREPDDETLKAMLDQMRDRYAKPPSYSFEIAVLTGSAVPNPDERDVYADLLLRALNNGASPELTGVPYQVHNEKNTAAVRALWGKDFATALSMLKVEDGWQRLESKRGPVLVKLNRVKQTEMPPFEAVRDNLLLDWKRQQNAAAVQKKVAELRKNYQVSWQGER